MNYYAGLTITGAVTGMIAGLRGGAEIFIPLLTMFEYGSIKKVSTSLFMLLPPVGIFATIKFYKQDSVDIFAVFVGSYVYNFLICGIYIHS